MTTKTYGVIGMTCEHCGSAVRAELGALPDVAEVTVTVAPGGVSQVTVVSAGPVPAADIVAALDEAGDYTLAADPA